MYIEIVNQWNAYLNSFSAGQKDIYFSEEYVRLAANNQETALCAVCKDGEKIMLFPFLRNTYKEYYDFETPYGYGGPISNTSDNDWNEKALKEIIKYFSSENYIAGFIRFHPLLKNAEICRNVFHVIDDRKTVSIDTSISEQEIWNNFVSSAQRQVHKAERNGLVFERDNEFKYMEEFKKLYNSTMSRLNADDFYYFNDEYYKNFAEYFNGKSYIGLVKKENEVISAALFMYENNYGHYHLAGSNREYTKLGSNNFLFWNVACEMHKNGVKDFHLGGGTNGDEENSLYKFKCTFSPNTKQFSIGKIIFNKNAYDEICSEWAKNNPEKAEKYKYHLLKYRY